jgi:hypothetical protein
MSDLPLLSICLVTCKRTREALETVRSTCENIGYPREQIGWYVADDGSPDEHHRAILNLLDSWGMRVIGHHNDRFRSDSSYNCGKGWNLGLGICHQASDFVLWMEDDWVLEKPMDIVPYVKLLQERTEVGVVTFRILSVGADVHTVGHNGEIFLKYHRNTQYAYSGNPLIRHARYTKHYGVYAEDRNPGLIELHQDDRYRLDVSNGPEIWRPATLDMWGGWHHIGEKIWR